MIKAESDYYPWGRELQFVNNDSNDYKFTGKKRDTETGLDYFGARYYSNTLGRWVSAEWSATPVPVPYANFGDPQSLNLYSYVRGIPTTAMHADGHSCYLSGCIDLPQLVKNLKSMAMGGAKEIHNTGVSASIGVPGVGENGLRDMAGNPLSESPRNRPESVGMYTVKIGVPLALACRRSVC